jgi:hypothetical protein
MTIVAASIGAFKVYFILTHAALSWVIYRDHHDQECVKA